MKEVSTNNFSDADDEGFLYKSVSSVSFNAKIL